MTNLNNTAEAYLPIEQVTQSHVATHQAAHYLNRKPATLREWSAATESAPLRPRRVNGRLAWPVADIKRLLGLSE